MRGARFGGTGNTEHTVESIIFFFWECHPEHSEGSKNFESILKARDTRLETRGARVWGDGFALRDLCMVYGVGNDPCVVPFCIWVNILYNYVAIIL